MLGVREGGSNLRSRARGRVDRAEPEIFEFEGLNTPDTRFYFIVCCECCLYDNGLAHIPERWSTVKVRALINMVRVDYQLE